MNVRKINIILFLLLAWVENHVLPANGDLDPSFDTDGKVTTSFGAPSEGHAVAIQSDGKIVVAGVAVVSGTGHFGLARYNTNGSLDATFGTGGLVTTSFGTTDKAYGVAIQPDGKIVAAGESDSNFALARYNTDGTLDATFGTGGLVTTSFGTTDKAYGVAIQPDGKIVAAGESDSNFALARYNTDGTLDTTFGTSGKVTTDFGSSTTDTGRAIALQSDNKIVVAGASDTSGTYSFAVARYLNNQTPTANTVDMIVNKK